MSNFSAGVQLPRRGAASELLIAVVQFSRIVHNFLQVHAETFPVIVELGAEVFLACSCSTRS